MASTKATNAELKVILRFMMYLLFRDINQSFPALTPCYINYC